MHCSRGTGSPHPRDGDSTEGWRGSRSIVVLRAGCQVDEGISAVGEARRVVAREARALAERMVELMAFARRGSAQAERALIVCDDVQLIARLAGLLSHACYRIDPALGTAVGYEALAQERPEVAVIDLRSSIGKARALARPARRASRGGWCRRRRERDRRDGSGRRRGRCAAPCRLGLRQRGCARIHAEIDARSCSSESDASARSVEHRGISTREADAPLGVTRIRSPRHALLPRVCTWLRPPR
jgi:hypothetical protein